jgi:phosphatidyl-myo-inositol dimannoside synthase
MVGEHRRMRDTRRRPSGLPAPQVLLISRVFPPKTGGIERIMYELHIRLNPGFNLAIIAPNFVSSCEFDLQSQAKPIYRSPYLGSRFKLTYIPLFAIASVMSAHLRPDIAIYDQVETGALGFLLKKLFGLPYIVFAYGAEMYDRGSAQLKKLVYRNAQKVVTCSADTAARVAQFAAIPQDAIEVIYPGVDVRRFELGDPEVVRDEYRLHGRRIILTVGRLSVRESYKGQDTVIRALPSVVEQVPEATYLVVGDGDDRPRLERLAAELGMQEHVVFAGRVPEQVLPAFYTVADAFVMVSKESDQGMTEGFGIVYLEAAAAGKPVVFASSGGTREAAVDGQTGLSVDPDDISAVAEAVTRLLANYEEAQTLGENGYRRAREQFTWERAACEYRRLLNQLLITVGNRKLGARA